MPQLYVPILKFKDAEKNVLRGLPAETLEQCYPLLESVPRERSKKIDEKTVYTPVDQKTTLRMDLDYINRYLSHIPLFFDSFNLSQVSRKELIQSLEHPTNLFGNKITPVVYVHDYEDLLSIKEIFDKTVSEHGICLRILPKEQEVAKVITDTTTFIKKLSLKTEQIYLLIDYQVTENYKDNFMSLLPELQGIGSWKLLMLASGAAPQYLSEFSLEEVSEHPRKDWKEWNKIKDLLKSTQLSYSDYGIRYPIFELLRNANTSNSIRYTGDNNWLIYRGKSPKAQGYQGTKQYRAHAMLLIKNPQYSGEHFSPGDRYINSMASLNEKDIEKNGSGNNTTWLQASTEHHIYKVIKQLCSN